MALNDGSANAPVGSPQLPQLLDSYGANRPAWGVAGVDYHVGVPDGLALKDPSTISMAGVSVDTTTHSVTVSGNDVTLDGYDFSGNGGWQVNVDAANTKIVNSNFVVGSNNYTPIVGTEHASNLTVSNTTIDGAGHDAGISGTLFLYSGTNFTIDHSWLKNSGGDTIQQTGGAGTITIEHNLIQDGGQSATSHGDFTQFEGGPFTVAMNYNTTVENNGETQGLMTEYVSHGSISNNTMVGNTSYFTSIDNKSLTGTLTVQDNYYDSSKSYGFAYEDGSSPLAVLNHNVDMTSGAASGTAPTVPTAPTSGTTVGTGSSGGATVADPSSTDTTGTSSSDTGSSSTDGSGTTGAGTHHVGTGSSGGATVSDPSSADTASPNAPVLVSDSIDHHHATVTGTADPGSTVQLYEGKTLLGSATADANGNWDVTTPALSHGSHTFTATATDAAGNTSALSAPLDPTIGSHGGTATANLSNSQVNPTDSTQAADGSGQNTVTTAGGGGLAGKGGADTLLFNSNFGHGGTDLTSSGSAHDPVQMSKTAFDSFASVLSHAAQSGSDHVSPTGSDTLTLKDMKIDPAHSHDFHFA